MEKYECLFDFTAEADNELTIKKGYILSSMNVPIVENWILVQIDNDNNDEYDSKRIGFVPLPYLKPITPTLNELLQYELDTTDVKDTNDIINNVDNNDDNLNDISYNDILNSSRDYISTHDATNTMPMNSFTIIDNSINDSNSSINMLTRSIEDCIDSLETNRKNSTNDLKNLMINKANESIDNYDILLASITLLEDAIEKEIRDA
jgi:hypothetical protein